ncbi:Diels-Alderase ccsF [Colletotrichum trifolii]|uniref:Diels-Alderase ccsF n=1 Tax=Colletotrichum trifolii TaxID=5466 RepID=A0A4R8RGI5_COLTR|nr:Diels-Alderase ccsF [Colletotrichum trifolii]
MLANTLANTLATALLVSSAAWGVKTASEPWPLHWKSPNLAGLAVASEDQQQQQLMTDAIEPSSSSSSGCQVSNLTAYDMAKGRRIVDFTRGATDSFETPKIRPLNSTAGEQWAFDGVSADGTQSFIFGFYRDPNYSILGAGNLRLSLEFAFADGTRFSELYYADRAVVESCPQGVRGTWSDDKPDGSGGYRFSFLVKADMSEAVVTLDSDTVRGTIVTKSRAMPIAADGHVWPNANASTEPVRHLHWAQPIPAGTLDFDVEVKGRRVAWSGIGGHERFWSAFSWFTCLRNLQGVRAMLGPYVLSFFRFESNLDRGHVHQSAALFRDGVPVFRSTRADPSDAEDYVLARKTYGGKVAGTLRDKVTGFQLELVSPANRRHYTFFVEHAAVAFEYVLGEGVGGSGFSGIARGGHVGLDQYDGVSMSEALTFPENSPLFGSNYVE